MKKIKYIIFSASIIFMGMGTFVNNANAAGLVPCGGHGEPSCRLCHLVIGIKNIIDWGFGILVFVAIAALVISGIMYIVSAGNEEMMKKAKGYITQTLTGFGIVLGAWLIINVTMYVLGASNAAGELEIGGKWYQANFICNN